MYLNHIRIAQRDKYNCASYGIQNPNVNVPMFSESYQVPGTLYF